MREHVRNGVLSLERLLEKAMMARERSISDVNETKRQCEYSLYERIHRAQNQRKVSSDTLLRFKSNSTYSVST